MLVVFITRLGETNGVGEENSPAVADVVVESDRTVGGVGLEVGGNGAETETEKVAGQN